MTIQQLQNYCSILGVDETATAQQIKQAYRQQAKVLHPDRNNSPNAHEQFIQLTEAYEGLMNLLNGNTTLTTHTVSEDDLYEQTKAEYRARAQEYAQMRYKEYVNSDHYKNTMASLTFIEHIFMVFGFVAMLSPLWGLFINGWAGFFLGLFFTVISVPFWAMLFSKQRNFDLDDFIIASKIVVQLRWFQLSVLGVINLILLCSFTLNTQISTLKLALIFTASILATLFIISRFGIKFKITTKSTIGIGIVPLVINLFFTINFIYSTGATVEVHQFKHYREDETAEYGSPPAQKTSYIYLKNNRYADYHWFRMFFDFDSMKDKKEVEYTFSTGFFGLRVLKDFKFTE